MNAAEMPSDGEPYVDSFERWERAGRAVDENAEQRLAKIAAFQQVAAVTLLLLLSATRGHGALGYRYTQNKEAAKSACRFWKANLPAKQPTDEVGARCWNAIRALTEVLDEHPSN